jgi:hypothetical protein
MMDNIKIDFIKMMFEGVKCVNLAQDREWWRALLTTAIHRPSGFVKFREFRD